MPVADKPQGTENELFITIRGGDKGNSVTLYRVDEEG